MQMKNGKMEMWFSCLDHLDLRVVAIAFLTTPRLGFFKTGSAPGRRREAKLTTGVRRATVARLGSVVSFASRRLPGVDPVLKNGFVIFHHLKQATEPHFAPAAVHKYVSA